MSTEKHEKRNGQELLTHDVSVSTAADRLSAKATEFDKGRQGSGRRQRAKITGCQLPKNRLAGGKEM